MRLKLSCALLFAATASAQYDGGLGDCELKCTHIFQSKVAQACVKVRNGEKIHDGAEGA